MIRPETGQITDDSDVVKCYENLKKLSLIEFGWFHGSIPGQLHHIFIDEIKEFMKTLKSNSRR